MLDVTLDRQVFAHLRALSPKTHQSALSPLTGPPTPDRKVSARLRAAGLTDKRGTPTAEGQDAASVLTRATSVAEVEITGRRVFAYAVYRPGRGQPVSVMTDANGLRVQQPARPAPVIEMVGEVLGWSRLAAAPFEAELPVVEAWALAALVDADRAVRLTRLGGGSADDAASTLRQLAQVLSSPTIVHATVRTLHRVLPPLNPSETELARALDHLARSGLVQEQPLGWRVAGEAADVAESLLVVEKFVTLRAASLDHGGELTRTVVSGAFAGAHGVLTAETDGEFVQLRSLAPYDVVSLTGGLLTDGIRLRPAQGREPVAG